MDKCEDYRSFKRTWKCECCDFSIKRHADIETLDFVCPWCGGKFVHTDDIEKVKKNTDSEYGWFIFLDSRKKEGIEQAIQVRRFLLEKGDKSIEGWVAYSDILAFVSKFSISRSRLDKLMADMEEYHIVHQKIEKDLSVITRNKNRKYYRFNFLADVRTKTEVGIKKEYVRLFSQNLDLSHKLIFAHNVLYRHGLLQEYHDDLKKWEAGREKKG